MDDIGSGVGGAGLNGSMIVADEFNVNIQMMDDDEEGNDRASQRNSS